MDVATTFFLGQDTIKRAPASHAPNTVAVSRNASVPPPRGASTSSTTKISRFDSLLYASPMPLSVNKFISSSRTAHISRSTQIRRPDIPTMPGVAAKGDHNNHHHQQQQAQPGNHHETPKSPVIDKTIEQAPQRNNNYNSNSDDADSNNINNEARASSDNDNNAQKLSLHEAENVDLENDSAKEIIQDTEVEVEMEIEVEAELEAAPYQLPTPEPAPLQPDDIGLDTTLADAPVQSRGKAAVQSTQRLTKESSSKAKEAKTRRSSGRKPALKEHPNSKQTLETKTKQRTTLLKAATAATEVKDQPKRGKKSILSQKTAPNDHKITRPGRPPKTPPEKRKDPAKRQQPSNKNVEERPARRKSSRKSGPRDYWILGSTPKQPLYNETKLSKRHSL